MTTAGSERSAVAQRAQHAIRATALTQRSISSQMGLDETKLSKSLSGRRHFTGTELAALAELTGVGVEWLRTGTSPENNRPEPGPADPEITSQHRKIVTAAWELFATHGFHAVRLEDIAQTAGLSSPTVLYHFGNKNEVFQACLDYSSHLWVEQSRHILDSDAPASARLRNLLIAQLPDDATTRLRWSLWAQLWGATPYSTRSTTTNYRSYHLWYEDVAALINQARADGEFLPLPEKDLLDVLTGLIDGLGIRVLAQMMEPARAKHLIVTVLDSYLVPEARTASTASTASTSDPPI